MYCATKDADMSLSTQKLLVMFATYFCESVLLASKPNTDPGRI